MASPALAPSAAHGTPARTHTNRLNQAAPWALALGVALALSLAYLLTRPPAGDLAAAAYRSELFARVGFTLRDSGWYAVHGHYLPGYSLLSPALGALLGERLVLALSAVAASVLFALVAERVFGAAAARVAAVWFAVTFCVGLLSGRVPYDLGFAIGLGSVLALLDGRLLLGLALALLTSVASPIAGAFLALAGTALALSGFAWHEKQEEARTGRAAGAAPFATGLALAVAALVPIVVFTVAFPEGGWEPFVPSLFWWAEAGIVAIALLLPQGTLTPRAHRAVRIGAALYALAMAGAFLLRTPVGGNAARLGATLVGPLLAGVLWGSHRRILFVLAPVLLYWQLETPINDLASLVGDPSVNASYYAPLRGELRDLTGGRRTIVEVPLTGSHWEAAYLAGHGGVALARGWERQLDTRYASLFYRSGLTPAAYLAWLRENRVLYVALPDVRLDEAGLAEGALIRGGLPYLREVWRSAHWRLYRFDPPPPRVGTAALARVEGPASSVAGGRAR